MQIIERAVVVKLLSKFDSPVLRIEGHYETMNVADPTRQTGTNVTERDLV